jgi:hypothetical protein
MGQITDARIAKFREAVVVMNQQPGVSWNC